MIKYCLDNGVHFIARANEAFIQHLLGDFQENETLAEKWFAVARKSYKKKFPITYRAASHMSGLTVGWRFFRRFAVRRGVITQAESNAYRNLVTENLASLMSKQKKIYAPTFREKLFAGLRNAIKGGNAYLKDSETGQQPTDVEPSKVGWHENKPKGLWIGWRDAKTGEVFIRGDLDIEKLIALLPEHDRDIFLKGPKTFWKDLKSHGVLKCTEVDRNTTRQVLANAKSKNNYHLKMRILGELKTIKPAAKPDKSKPASNSKANTAKKSIKGK